MKKIFFFEFRQESNTFNPVVAEPEHFNSGLPFEGDEMTKLRLNTRHSVQGAVHAIRDAGGDVIPSMYFRAPSGGRVSDQVMEMLKEGIKRHLDAAGEIDGVYAALHGATCTESEDDACGAIIEYVRSLIGEDKPIAVSHDLHAKVTEKMLRNAQIVCGYHTYPHLDFYETGYRAGKLLMEKVAGSKAKMVTVAIPMLIPPAGYTTQAEPFKSLITMGDEMVATGKIQDYSVFAVQPWLDIEEIDSRVITIGEDIEAAKECASKLAQRLFEIRDEVQPPMLTVDEIIDIAEKNTTGKPVLLAESADSPNGGAVGDSPVVALRVLERGSKVKTGLFVTDPAAVEHAFEVGVGNTGTFTFGAAFTPGVPGPVTAQARVRSLHDGWWTQEGAAGRGTAFCFGRSAVINIGNVDVLLITQGGASGDPQVLRHFGIEPTLYDLIVVKANTSFRAPYAPISDLVYVADTAGACASNLHQLKWEKLKKGIYPFDLPADYTMEEPTVW